MSIGKYSTILNKLYGYIGLSLLCSKIYVLVSFSQISQDFYSLAVISSPSYVLFLIILVTFIVSMIIMCTIYMVTITLENRMLPLQNFLQNLIFLHVHVHHNHCLHYTWPLCISPCIMLMNVL